jgi:putative Holliday junction resolvase
MLEISIPSSIEYLPLVDTLCQAFCVWAGVSQEAADEISMAAVEASTNAVVHGNRCQRSKKVRAVFEKTPCEIKISVTDEGSGFEPSSVPDPTAEENLLKDCGRGIYIMRQVMDSVDFEWPKTGGTRVRLVKALNPPHTGRILGIDYGQKRIGLAISDELGITAQPVGKIEEDGDEDRMKAIAKVVKEKGVTEIVVGLPLTLRGDVSQATSKVISFARDLNRQLCVSVVTWDERLSTKQGEKVLIESGLKRSKRKHVVDSVAAAIILQNYLDARRKT